MIRTPRAGLGIASRGGELGERDGVLDLALLSPGLHADQGGYSPPNFRAATSYISARKMVPYMSMVVLYDSCPRKF